MPTAKLCANGHRCFLPAHLRGQPQPLDQFRDRRGHEVNTCQTCRDQKKASRARRQAGQRRRIGSIQFSETPPGPPPKFASEGHRQMWQAWLRDLVGQVQRSSS